MKFCAVICEFNPFHNGHAYLFQKIRENGYEHILCLMSGNFTQRGEAAVLDKYTRARHAVLAGADVVLELPAAFSVCPAELFAAGGVHLLASLPAAEALAFGCESGDRERFLAAAAALSREDKNFRLLLKEKMKDGTSYIRARNEILLGQGEADAELLSSPNNILGTEYCRALLKEGSSLLPLPILRTGAGHADTGLHHTVSSASAIRTALAEGKRGWKHSVPPFVSRDLAGARPLPYGEAVLCALLKAGKEQIAATPDCSEGLENRLLSLVHSNPLYEELIRKTVSKRYTAARVRRILAQTFLGITLKNVRQFLSVPLYANVLAVCKEAAEEVFSSLSGPLLVRRNDRTLLKKEAAECYAIDHLANELYGVLAGKRTDESETLFVSVP